MGNLKAEYNLINTRISKTLFYRVDMANGTGYTVVITSFVDGDISVGIDRKGFFTFSGYRALVGDGCESYVGEKLFLNETDAKHLCIFFKSIIQELDLYDEEGELDERN